MEKTRPDLFRTVHVLRALANDTRLRIVALLRERELTVCQIAATLDQAMSTTSNHLSILARERLVESRRAGRYAYYRLHSGDRAVAWLPSLDPLFLEDTVLRRDAEVLGIVLREDLDSLCERVLEVGRAARETTG